MSGVNVKVFHRPNLEKSSNFDAVKQISESLVIALNTAKVQEAIAAAHIFKASSHAIQASILDEVSELGFESEKKGLFSGYAVSGIRPDYFKPLVGGGILFEVERGKTLANNMDLLDVWKTHICKEAKHLFLLVPNVRVQGNGKQQNIFNTVSNRVGAFFAEDAKPLDIDSVTLFGY